MRLAPTLQAIQRQWPPGYRYRIAGEMDSASKGHGHLEQAFIAAACLIFVLLTLMLVSEAQRLIILLTVPLAITG